MEALLQKFEHKKPEIVFEWSDTETEAQGWIVINSLRGGAAGGGTRMRLGLDQREVESLAKTMEIKFTVSGPAIGGAKSGINFDPKDPRKKDVLKRWYKAALPILKHYYGTGGDLNIDEIHEVIPITEQYGLWHPQEGVVNGHFKATEGQKINIIAQLRNGVSKQVSASKYTSTPYTYTVADLITGWGVAQSILSYYKYRNTTIVGKKAIIQGWGNVGAAAGYYLSQMGVKIVGILDKELSLLQPDGLNAEAVKTLFETKKHNSLYSPEAVPTADIQNDIWNEPAHIFIPAAASRLVTQNQMEKLISNGLEVVSCGANVPFADPEIFYGSISKYVDQHISLIPDFIANCGMARVFAYLMQHNADLSDKAIFDDVTITIDNALKNILQTPNFITQRAFEHALKQLV